MVSPSSYPELKMLLDNYAMVEDGIKGIVSNR
jgi:hypothetical protein